MRIRIAIFSIALCCFASDPQWGARAEETLEVGMAESDITPPLGFPMAGYYHERLATGARDPLKAKAIVLKTGDQQAALVVCDLTGIAYDLTAEVRKRASASISIPAENIILTATHSHTAPDYTKDLYDYLEAPDTSSSKYAPQLIQGIVDAIARAQKAAKPTAVHVGVADQQTPIAFNRRFVMKDGSVQTWMSLDNPQVVRPAGPIDPEAGVVVFRADGETSPMGTLSNFALHLDTVGGMLWSGDYPYFVEQTLRAKHGKDLISIFGTGCCGDINHIDPSRKERNATQMIGESLGATIDSAISAAKPVSNPKLSVMHRTVEVPLEHVSPERIERATKLLTADKAGEKVAFFDLVDAHKSILLDHLINKPPRAETASYINWGLSRQLAGVGPNLPVEVHVMALGDDVAIVTLPGEVFVELGLTIKRASPYKTTLVIELANSVETIYIPTRAAYAGGGYEVANSAVQPGSGEMLAETAVQLLRELASRKAAGP